MKSEADTKNLAFVLANTALAAPPLVPEIRLRLADDVLPLWQRTERLGAGDPPPPYWAFAWPGGQALARYILDNAGDFRGKTILDFGAGSGLVGIAAVKAGAKAVAAEIDLLAITAIKTNAAANNLEISCLEEDIIGRDEGWDTICFGDMCYERPLAQRIIGWASVLKARGAHVLLGDPDATISPKRMSLGLQHIMFPQAAILKTAMSARHRCMKCKRKRELSLSRQGLGKWDSPCQNGRWGQNGPMEGISQLPRNSSTSP